MTNGAEGGVDELSQEEAFEEKLRDAMVILPINNSFFLIFTKIFVKLISRKKRINNDFFYLLLFQDLASQKSAQGRTMALESMCTAFNKKFIPEFVEDRRMTITGIYFKIFKRKIREID